MKDDIDAIEALAMESHVGIGLGFLEVGEDRGGVTGALFDILKGGRDVGNACRMYGMRFDGLFASKREGLGKEEEEGLTWYEGIGLGNDDERGLGFCDENGVFLAEVPTPPSPGSGALHPLR